MTTNIQKKAITWNSVSELNKHVDIKVNINTMLQCQQYCSSANGIFKKAENLYRTGDEENAYILFMRYLHVVQCIKKTYEYTKSKKLCDDILNNSDMLSALSKAETLQKSLEERYARKKTEIQTKKEFEKRLELEKQSSKRNQLNEARTNSTLRSNDDDLILPDVPDTFISEEPGKPKKTYIDSNDDKKATVGANSKADESLPEEQNTKSIQGQPQKPVPGYISVFDFYDLYKQHKEDPDCILVIDIRPREEFDASSLSCSCIINIPDALLQPGANINSIDRKLDGNTWNIWKIRFTKKYVVIVDYDFDDELSPSTCSANILQDVLCKFEGSYQVFILVGGFIQWHLHYPSMTTNPHYTKQPKFATVVEPSLLLQNLKYPKLPVKNLSRDTSKDETPVVKPTSSLNANARTNVTSSEEVKELGAGGPTVDKLSQLRKMIDESTSNNVIEKTDTVDDLVMGNKNNTKLITEDLRSGVKTNTKSLESYKEESRIDVSEENLPNIPVDKKQASVQEPKHDLMKSFGGPKTSHDTVSSKPISKDSATDVSVIHINEAKPALSTMVPSQPKQVFTKNEGDDSSLLKQLANLTVTEDTSNSLQEKQLPQQASTASIASETTSCNTTDISTATVQTSRTVTVTNPPRHTVKSSIAPAFNVMPGDKRRANEAANTVAGVVSDSNPIVSLNAPSSQLTLDKIPAKSTQFIPETTVPQSIPTNQTGVSTSIHNKPQKPKVDSMTKQRYKTTFGLPDGWEKAINHENGRMYYINHNNRTTHWELPPEIRQTVLKNEVEPMEKMDPSVEQVKKKTVRFAEEAKPTMKRSFSSPNLAEIDESKNNKKSALPPTKPIIDRSVKPREEKKMYADRSTKPISKSRLQNLTPVNVGRGPCLTGLANLGNTCYMNSVLQCLSCTIPLSQYFYTSLYEKDLNKRNMNPRPTELARELAFLMGILAIGQYGSVSPIDFKSALGRFSSQFNGRDQQDAHELLMYLLDGLHEDVNKIKARQQIQERDDSNKADIVAAQLAWKDYQTNNNSVVVDLFQGQFRSTVVCLSCNKTSKTFDAFNCLQLELPPNRSASLQDCIKMFTKPERIGGDDSWKCPHCKCYRTAAKTIEIWKMPAILIVQLKRFRFDGRWRNKIQTSVNFPVQDFNISNYAATGCGSKYTNFQLFGVINHYGSFESGHYTAFCRNPNNSRWYQYDDSIVRDMDSSSVKTNAAYLLFYTAIDFKSYVKK